MDSKKHSKAFKIVIAALAAALVVAIIMFFVPGPEKTVKKYLDSMLKGDGTAVYKLAMNPYELTYRLNSEHYSYKTEQNIINEFTARYRMSSDVLKASLGNNPKTKIKVTDAFSYSKSDIEKLNKYISIVRKDIYKTNALQDVRLISTETTILGSSGSETRTDETVVYKINGKWYVSADAFCPSALANKEGIRKILTRYAENQQ